MIQRNDGTCLYHLASVVDDDDFKITHVVRAIEHLSNTPRQIFIARSLGYQLPAYAHIPFVAEPGSKTKLSKRKIEKYLKNREFRDLYEHGAAIASRIGLQQTPESFNPVLIDFYRETGFLPDAIVNYLLLVGWSLDDKTEMFSRQEMLNHFSLERVVRNEASFDPAKLTAFQGRYMTALDPESKTRVCQAFLIRGGTLTEPVTSEQQQRIAQVAAAAGDRIVIAGDILQFDSFFRPANDLQYDEKAFEKRLVQAERAGHLLAEYKKVMVVATDWSAGTLEGQLKHWCEQMEIRIGDIIHALRVALTGQSTGFGMFEAMEILGQAECVARIDIALQRLQEARSARI